MKFDNILGCDKIDILSQPNYAIIFYDGRFLRWPLMQNNRVNKKPTTQWNDINLNGKVWLSREERWEEKNLIYSFFFESIGEGIKITQSL